MIDLKGVFTAGVLTSKHECLFCFVFFSFPLELYTKNQTAGGCGLLLPALVAGT